MISFISLIQSHLIPLKEKAKETNGQAALNALVIARGNELKEAHGDKERSDGCSQSCDRGFRSLVAVSADATGSTRGSKASLMADGSTFP